MDRETMQALVYEGPGKMNIRETLMPKIGNEEVLIQVKKVGICGSELSGYLGENSLRIPPLVMGHEFAGVIVEVGKNVKVFRIGDRVTVNPLISCRECSYCRSGQPQLCSNRKIVGAHQSGAFAEYVSVPWNNVHTISDRMSMEDGALTEPLACAVHACKLAQVNPTGRMLILGAGPIGLLILQAASIHGVENIIVMDLNKERLKIAEAMGGIAVQSEEELVKLTPGEGFDFIVDAVGVNATRKQAVEKARKGGKVVFSGLHEAESPIPVNISIRNELSLFGSFCYDTQDFETALKWLESKKVVLDSWIQHSPLEEGQACFEKLLSDPGPIAKIMLHIS